MDGILFGARGTGACVGLGQGLKVAPQSAGVQSPYAIMPIFTAPHSLLLEGKRIPKAWNPSGCRWGPLVGCLSCREKVPIQ